MVKIAKPVGLYIFLYVFVFFQSCSREHPFDKSHQDLVFKFNSWLSVNIETKILEIKYGNRRYRDTVNLSDEDLQIIFDSFEKNRITDLSGEFFYGDYVILPPSDLEIQVYENSKLKSSVIVAYDFMNKNAELPLNGQEVMNFKNDVMSVFRRQPEIVKARELCRTWHDEDMTNSRRPIKR